MPERFEGERAVVALLLRVQMIDAMRSCTGIYEYISMTCAQSDPRHRSRKSGVPAAKVPSPLPPPARGGGGLDAKVPSPRPLPRGEGVV